MNIRDLGVRVAAGGALLLPAIAFAQSPQTGYISSLISQIQGIVNQLVPLLVGVAIVVFIWGVITYTTAGESEDKQKKGRNYMIWGIIAIFVIVSIWGLVAILRQLTGTTVNTAITPATP